MNQKRKKPTSIRFQRAAVNGRLTRVDHVPHLVVKQVQLLQALQVVLVHGRIGDRPNAQVVHVRQQPPVVAEGDLLAVHKPRVLVLVLAVVP